MKTEEGLPHMPQANARHLYIPTVPNAPLISKHVKQNLGILNLRKNKSLDFIENSAFDASLIEYDERYQNNQAHSNHFLGHMTAVMELLKARLPKNSTVVEVGCGKGDFVELLNKDGYFNACGYDATYEGHSDKIFKRYLTDGDNIETDLVVLRHVLEHIQRPHDFLKLIKSVFQKGQIYIEVPNWDWIIRNQAFFDITYEHVNYFSQKSLTCFFENTRTYTGLLFGDQYQYILSNIESISENFSDKYNNDDWFNIDFYTLFPNIKNSVTKIINRLKPTSSIYIWGAATKGCMFLVCCKDLNLLIDKVRYAIDINPDKQNKFLPYSLIPIKSKEEFFKAVKSEDLLLISNPIYEDEILQDLHLNNVERLEIICL